MDRRQLVFDYWNSKPPLIQTMLLNRDGSFLDTEERPEILSYLPQFKNKVVLDLAAGTGRFTREFAKLAKKVKAVDLCPHFIQQNKCENKCFQNVDWIVSDAMDIDFPNEYFDLIFISWLLMYLSDMEIKTLSMRLSKWLKPSGHLFFRESCAAVTHFTEAKEVYAHYRSPRDYDRFFKGWNPLKLGNIQAYENFYADPFKCFWLYKKS